MSLRAILFDAGNTLLFLEYPRLARAVGEATGVSLTADDLEMAAPEAALHMETVRGTDQERAAVYLGKLFELAGVPAERAHEIGPCLRRLHGERHLWCGTDPGTAETLAALQALGLRLGVVSNSDGRVEAALEAAGLRDYFDVVVDSGLVGVEKPDPAIFRFALERLDVAAEETLYVGDLYEVDVVGARAAGLDVALVDPRGVHRDRDVWTIGSVADLLDELTAGVEI